MVTFTSEAPHCSSISKHADLSRALLCACKTCNLYAHTSSECACFDAVCTWRSLFAAFTDPCACTFCADKAKVVRSSRCGLQQIPELQLPLCDELTYFKTRSL